MKVSWEEGQGYQETEKEDSFQTSWDIKSACLCFCASESQFYFVKWANRVSPDNPGLF